MLVKKIEVPIYKHFLVFITDCDYSGLRTYLSEEYEIDWLPENGSCGRSFKLEATTGAMMYFIWMRKYDNLVEDHVTLSHEISHHVFWMFNDLGMTRTKDSDEAYAYYDGWVTEEILKALNEYRLNKGSGEEGKE